MGPMMRNSILKTALIFLLLIAIAGCSGASSSNGITGTNPGILKGAVTIGPLCPAEVPGDQCKPKPDLYTSHEIVILSESGNSVIATTALNADGSYQIELNAGSYLVDYSPHD